MNKKSPATVVRVFVPVAKGVPDSTLTMIGDGPLREKCIKLASEHGVSDRGTFPGSLSHAEVAVAMCHARCFVQHSVTSESGDKEGTPNSAIEASAFGLAVVSTRHAGIPEAVIHGETGLLCGEGDEDAMVQNMMAMAENTELAGEYGCAGRKHIMTKYDADNQLNKLQSILVAAWENYRNQHE